MRDLDMRIAVLKTIAILCVILAHVNAPPWIFQLRNFDVPLLVLISGMLFARVYGNGPLDTAAYLKKRIARLIFPTWYFFIIFFAATLLIFWGRPYPFALRDVVGSFILSRGIDVWIIRIFVLLAFAAPLLFWLRRRSGRDRNFCLWLVLVYCLYELSYRFILNHPLNIHRLMYFLNNHVFYLLPYSCVFGLGMCVEKWDRKKIYLAAGIFFLAFAILFLDNNSAFTQGWKYPPRLYYFSYALFVSLLLLGVMSSVRMPPTIMDNFFAFVNKYSLEIYLWQIAFLKGWGWFIAGRNFIPGGNFVVKFFIILLLSCGGAFLQGTFRKAKGAGTDKNY